MARRPGYIHLNIPRRGRFYFAFGVGLIFWQTLRYGEAPLAAVFGICFFLATVVWLAFRQKPAGMEIRDGRWRFFVGHRQWSVALRDVAAVRVTGENALELELRDGQTDVLPTELSPEIEPLRRELARQGIPLEA